MAAERLLKAEAKFSHSLKFICNQVQKISKAEAKIKKFNSKLTDIMDSSDDTSDDTSDLETDKSDEKKKAIARKKKAKLEAEYREALQKKRDQYVTQKKLCEQQIFEHFDDTLGGMHATVKCSKNELDLPKQLEKATMRTIIDAFKTYFLHRANEYWAILPYVYYILSSYNPKTGLFYQPPSKGTDYANVPEAIRPMFRTQAELFYRVILTCIKQSGMATITQQFLCGIHKDKPASCSVDDGPMAMYCLMAKYAKVDDQHLISLEQEFINAPHHFMSGSPAMKVKHLVPYLEEVLELGVKLKASQTIIPIVDILTQRENKFAVELAKYADGGNSPDDCAVTIEQLFSDITRTCNRLENAAGSQDIWYTRQHQVHLADVQAPGKGKGKGRGKCKGKGKGKGKSWQHAYYAYDPTQKNSTAQPESGKCWAQGCTAKCGHKFRFCLECWKKGMETGSIPTYDGTQFEVKKDRKDTKRDRNGDKKNKNNFGFSKDNMRGMAALTEHISDHVSSLLEPRLGSAHAHHIEPFSDQQPQQQQLALPAAPSIFDRLPADNKMAQSHQAKRQKKVDFLNNLSTANN